MNLGTENEATEFVERISELDEGVRSLTAMLNRHSHGTVYFGVDDKGNVIGMDIGRDTTESIRNHVRSKVLPQIVPEVEEMTSDDGKKYIALRATGSNVPYSYDGRYYIRNVSSDESAGPDVVSQLVMSKGQDPMKSLSSDVQDLTFDELFGMMSSRKLHPVSERGFFRSHGMCDGHGRFNLTAYLLSDQNRITMQVVRFNGCDRSSMSERMNFGGRCLISAMRAVMEYVSSYIVTKVDLSKGERIEHDLFDFESFREAWINACVHNAWWAMLPPSVMIFDDRIEVISYGAIPFPMSYDRFYEGDSRPVNRSLYDMFSLLKLTGQGTNGTPVIVQRYGKEAFNVTDCSLSVTIPFAFEPDYVLARKETARNRMGLDQGQTAVLNYLSRNPEAKLSEAAESTGLSLSMVKKVVTELKGKGLLMNKGTNRRSIWSVV